MAKVDVNAFGRFATSSAILPNSISPFGTLEISD